MNTTTEQILTLLVVTGMGLGIGKIAYRGVSLGTCGVVFSGLLAGHFGYEVPQLAGVAGILLFAYCLGISAGPSFWAMFLQRGKALVIMTIAMLFAAGGVAWLLAKMMHLSPDLACGLLAGAMTSTPALATAVERLPVDSDVTVGFGIAYPFGVVGVILFVQLAPKFYLKGLSKEATNGFESNVEKIERLIVKVTNPTIVGKRLGDVSILANANCQISRVMIDDELQPLPASFHLELGQRLLLIGRASRIHEVIQVLGEECDHKNFMLDVERQRKKVVVTSRNLIGKSLKELHLLSRFGVTISRIARHNIEFVPSSNERIQFGDALTAIGEFAALEKFIAAAGHRERTLDETNLISLCAGLGLGVLAGRVEIGFGSESVSLGLAGGPLLMGLILGGVGTIGPLVGHIPRAARFLLAEIGLAMFLAQAGSQAGGNLIQVILQHGFVLCLAACAIVITPLIVGFLVAKYVLKLSMLETFGGICGAMTSTPGLGAVTSTTESSTPATSYATVYPMALILITLLVPMLLSVMR